MCGRRIRAKFLVMGLTVLCNKAMHFPDSWEKLAKRGAIICFLQKKFGLLGSCLKTGQHTIFVMIRKIEKLISTRMLDTTN